MRKRKNNSTKLGVLFIIILISLMSTSVSYSLWYDYLHIDIDVETGIWEADIKIQKTLDYIYRENSISRCNMFRLTITVWNDGPANLTDVIVTDTLGDDSSPIFGSEVMSHGYLSWINTPVPDGEINELTWYIGDLLIAEIATLSIDLAIELDCSGVEIASVVINPEDDTTISVPRYNHATGVTGLGYYYIEHKESSRIVKYENIEPNLGDDGNVETDTFVITVQGGSNVVKIKTKAGQQSDTNYLSLGNTVTDDMGFIIEFASISYLVGGLKEYTFYVTSDSSKDIIYKCPGTPALSHIEFDFGYYTEDCEVEVNAGATVTANAGTICGILEATTESIVISKNYCGQIQPPLPYSTPWAEDYCYYCPCCDEEIEK